MYRVVVCETMTGVIVQDVQHVGLPQFSVQLSDACSWSVDVLVDNKANRGIDFTQYMSPRFSFILFQGDYPVEGGPVWSYAVDDNSRKITFSGSGFAGLYKRWIVRNPAGTVTNINHTSNDSVYTNLSLRGLLQSLAGDALLHTGHPVSVIGGLPGTADPGTENRTYYGYDLKNVYDAMHDVSDAEGGPEFRFQPWYDSTSGKIWWEAQIGSPLLGNQASTDVWDYGAALSRIDIDGDASASPAYHAFEKGSGMDRDAAIGFAQNNAVTSFGAPLLDIVGTTHNDVADKNTLAKYAQKDLRDNAVPLETWDCTVRIDGVNDRGGRKVSPAIGEFSLGDKPSFAVSGHWLIPNGIYPRRITGYSSDTEQTIKLSIEPTKAVLT